MLTLQQSTSHANIYDGVFANHKHTHTQSMSSLRMKKYKRRPDLGTNSPSYHNDNLRTQSIVQGYSSSDQSSNSRSLPRDVQFFHPSKLPRLKVYHQDSTEFDHVRSSTLPQLPPLNCLISPRNHERPLSAVPQKRNKKRCKKKLEATQSSKPCKKSKHRSIRRHNTEAVAPLKTPQLVRSDTKEYGGPKPYFVTRTPVTSGPFSPNAPNDSIESDNIGFPDTEWMAEIDSPRTCPISPPENPFSPKARVISPTLSAKTLRIRSPTHGSVPPHQSHVIRTHTIISPRPLPKKRVKRVKKKPPLHQHGASMDYDYERIMRRRNAKRNQKKSNKTPPSTYGDYTGYPEKEKKRRKKKSSKKKRHRNTDIVPNFVNDYHIVDLDNDEWPWIFCPDIDDTVLYQ